MSMNISSLELKKSRVESSSCCCKCFSSLINIFRKKVNTCPEKNGQKENSFLDLLPTEIILEIAKYLPARDVVNFSTTSRRYQQLINSSSLLWTHFFLRDFPDEAGLLKKEKRHPQEIYKSQILKRKHPSPVVVHDHRFYSKPDNQPRVVMIGFPPFVGGVFVY